MSTNNTDTKSSIVKIPTWLPIFPGFYNTLFDTSESQGRFEADLIKAGLVEKDYDLDFDNESFNNDVLKECCKWVQKNLPKEAGIINIKLEGIVSPRGYNFSNDSGNIEIELDIEKFSLWFSEYINGKFVFEKSKEVREALNNISNQDKKILMLDNGDEGYWEKSPNKAEWEKHLERHYQSRSGFSSFYSYHAEDWKDDTNNYRFDKEIDTKDIYRSRNDKIVNGAHSLGRCLEFYLENDNNDAYEAMYYFACEHVYADSYIKNWPENVTTEDLDKHNIDGLRF